MYALALRQLGGDTAAADDAVHTAWIRAAERMERFRGDAAIATWLCGFVIRVAWEAIRRDRQRQESAEVEVGLDDRRLTGVVDRVDLERAIATIAPGYRQVLVLHDVEGYTHAEIGELLGIAAGTSKSQLARARAALRQQLGGAHHD